jgi:hypothetical protein
MEEDLKKLDDLFDSIIEEIIHPEKAGTFKNPFVENKTNRIAELSEAVTVIMVKISDDSMAAYATVISKNENHKPFKADDILRVASTNGVFYGIDEEAVNLMAEKQLINTEVRIASGVEPVNGTDGRVSLKIDINEGSEVQGITAGTEICHVVSPHTGRDGKDVRGRMLPAENGKTVDISVSDGIVKRGNRYYAEYSGTLILREGVYSIVDEMVLDKNVDQSSGIIGYGGTIIINGNVSGKAVIRAGRGVIVHGMVTSSVIEAEKDIYIDGRVTDASLSSTDGNISGNEFSDSTMVAGGRVKASVINNCTVKCVTGIDCTIGYGRITGGDIYCAGDVNCLTIGSREHTETHITLGDSTEFKNEIRMLEYQIEKLDSEIAKITEQVNEIREREKAGTATLDDKGFLDAAMRIRAQKTNEKAPINERMKKLSAIIESSNSATIRAKTMIYGGAFLKICGFTQIINSDRSHATVCSNGTNVVVK